MKVKLRIKSIQKDSVNQIQKTEQRVEGCIEHEDGAVVLHYRERSDGFEGDSVAIRFLEGDIHMSRQGRVCTDMRFLPGDPQAGKYVVEGFELKMEVTTRKLDWVYDANAGKLRASLSYELCWANGEAIKTRLEISATRLS